MKEEKKCKPYYAMTTKAALGDRKKNKKQKTITRGLRGERERQRARERQRETERDRERQRQRDRHRHRQRERERERETETELRTQNFITQGLRF